MKKIMLLVLFSILVIACAKVPEELETKEAPAAGEIKEAQIEAPTEERTFCAADVRECPDGSFVSRIPPSCQFALCPAKAEVKEEKIEAPKEPIVVTYEVAEIKETILKEGNFRRGTATARGIVQIVERNQNYYVKLTQLNIEKGNQLFVYLAKEPSPRLPSDLYYKGYLNLGSLKSTTEDQEYLIPKEDIKEYNSVVIYENIGNKIHAVAELE